MYSRQAHLSCTWNQDAHDYDCEVRHTLDLDWTSRNELARVAAPQGHEETPQIFAVDDKHTVAVPVTVLHDEHDQWTPTPDYPLGEPFHLVQIDDAFTVTTKPVLHDGTFSVMAVTFTEHEHHTLIWIGGDSSTGKIDALRIASDAPEYVQCNVFITPESASSTEVEKPFRATLHMQPPKFATGDKNHYEDQHLCPRDVQVSWSDAFIVNWDDCEAAVER